MKTTLLLLSSLYIFAHGFTSIPKKSVISDLTAKIANISALDANSIQCYSQTKGYPNKPDAASTKVSCDAGACFKIYSEANGAEILWKGCLNPVVAILLKPFGIGTNKDKCVKEKFSAIGDVEASMCVCVEALCNASSKLPYATSLFVLIVTLIFK